MIEFDGTRIAVAWPHGEELGVPVGKRFDACRNGQFPAFRFQSAVACNTCLVSRASKQLGRSDVLDVAVRAFGCGGLLLAMNRAIVALEASLVGDAGLPAGALDVARGAVLLKRGVMRIERTAAERSLIARTGPPSDPDDAYDNSDQCEADAPPRNREFTLKVVPLDPLGAALGVS
jgi:hypothetical protein